MPTPTQVVVGGTGSLPHWEELIDTGAGEVSFNTPRSERRWLVTNVGDVNDLIVSAPDNIPQTNVRGGVTHFFRRYRYDPAQPTDGTLWIVVAQYEFEVEYKELSFDTSGATTTTKTALDEGDYYNLVDPSDDELPDFGKLIGVNGNNVEGCEVPIGKFDFTVLIRNRFAALSSDYIFNVEDLTGHANDRPMTINWKGQVFPFDTEELIYLGAPGKMTSEDGFELTLKFTREKNKSGGTKTTSGLVVPDVDETVEIQVFSTAGLTEGQRIYFVGVGHFEVDEIINGTTVVIMNLGGPLNAVPTTSFSAGVNVIFAATQTDALTIGDGVPIEKRGARYLWTYSDWQNESGSRRVLKPLVAVVNKVIPTADLTPLGIFS